MNESLSIYIYTFMAIEADRRVGFLTYFKGTKVFSNIEDGGVIA